MDLNNKIKTREILQKKPFLRVTPLSSQMVREVTSLNVGSDIDEMLNYTVVTQGEFIREFEPTGHKINDPVYYPNRIKFDEKSGKFFEEKVMRCSFPFQKVITIKHLCHLCGNDIQFEITKPKESDADNNDFFELKSGWLQKNMEVYWYEAAKAAKITGDCAIVCYMNNGKFGAKNISFLTGDKLYPHFDSITGELTLFARTYNDYDEDNTIITKWMEVWDKEYLYLFKQGTAAESKITSLIKGLFGLDGYKLVRQEPHSFDEIPVAYYRNDRGACWSESQDSIDKYELAVSHLCQNNMAYAFPIMYMKGEDIEIVGDIYGAVKAITMGKDDDSGFLSRQDSSPSFELQLKILLQNIFMGSFAVLPPEVKSGDLPGVAVKLLYSPAVEQAMADAKEFNPFIDTLVRLFSYGYGIEKSKLSKFQNLNVIAWIKPYIHQNDTEIFTNLATGVQNGFVSMETASDRVSDMGYTKNYEWDRILREKKEEQQMEILTDLKFQENKKTISPKTGADGGSVVSSRRKTDENGNYPGENNWDTVKKYT